MPNILRDLFSFLEPFLSRFIAIYRQPYDNIWDSDFQIWVIGLLITFGAGLSIYFLDENNWLDFDLWWSKGLIFLFCTGFGALLFGLFLVILPVLGTAAFVYAICRGFNKLIELAFRDGRWPIPPTALLYIGWWGFIFGSLYLMFANANVTWEHAQTKLLSPSYLISLLLAMATFSFVIGMMRHELFWNETRFKSEKSWQTGLYYLPINLPWLMWRCVYDFATEFSEPYTKQQLFLQQISQWNTQQNVQQNHEKQVNELKGQITRFKRDLATVRNSLSQKKSEFRQQQTTLDETASNAEQQAKVIAQLNQQIVNLEGQNKALHQQWLLAQDTERNIVDEAVTLDDLLGDND